MTGLLKIPTLDLRDGTSFAAKALLIGEALENFGFVNVVNHGVDPAALAAAYDVARKTFALPLEAKMSYHAPEEGGHTGYVPEGMESAKDSTVPDIKEFWHVRKNVPAEKLRVPIEIPEFAPVCFALCDQLDKLGDELLSLIEWHLHLPMGTLVQQVRGGDSLLRLLRYPQLKGGEVGVRAGAHEDINHITLLPAATHAGLEVKTRDGIWIPINNPPDAVICNAGDMLDVYTGGRIRSTTHRVVNGDGAERYSMPYFVHPRAEVVLRNAPRLTAREYLLQRLRELGLLKD